jgi:hypothetical protein
MDFIKVGDRYIAAQSILYIDTLPNGDIDIHHAGGPTHVCAEEAAALGTWLDGCCRTCDAVAQLQPLDVAFKKSLDAQDADFVKKGRPQGEWLEYAANHAPAGVPKRVNALATWPKEDRDVLVTKLAKDFEAEKCPSVKMPAVGTLTTAQVASIQTLLTNSKTTLSEALAYLNLPSTLTIQSIPVDRVNQLETWLRGKTVAA